jgi:ribonuclease T2
MWMLAWVLPAVIAGGAAAQTAPHAELPSADQPARQVPTTGYTLAMSWAPEYCHSRRGQGGDDAECGSQAARGFTLHGLWPDGDGPNRWPQYCHPVAILTEAQMTAALAYTPSRQLLQHEWAKHGSCTGTDPVRYFADEDRLYRSIAIPDMGALARRRDLTGNDVAAAFAAANPGLPAQAVRLNVNKRGWMEEVWLCLGLDKRPRPCAASAGGAPMGAAVRIETGGRNYRSGGSGRGYWAGYRRY